MSSATMPESEEETPRVTRQTLTAATSAAVFVVCALILSFAPIPFVVWTPKDSHDIMGTIEVDGKQLPIIDVEGIPTYPTNGRLDLSTIAESSPDALVSLPEALLAHWMPQRDVLPRDLLYPPGMTTDQLRDEGTLEMNMSQYDASVAALRAAGHPIRALPMVTTVTASGPADGKLRPRDFILSVDNQQITSIEEIRAAMRKHSVGDTVDITYLRDGNSADVTLTLVQSNQEDNTPVLGVKFDMGYSHQGRIDFRADAAVGGPSGGLAFALGLYDRITEGDLLQGRHMAATGTISSKGEVGAVGGIQEKIGAAEAAGATVMLMPRSNCADLAGMDGTKILVVPVSTLNEAISVTENLNDSSQGVPTCS